MISIITNLRALLNKTEISVTSDTYFTVFNYLFYLSLATFLSQFRANYVLYLFMLISFAYNLN